MSQIFNGTVDEVVIFDTPLVAADIKLIVNMGIKKALGCRILG